jgi:hypothetical protein
LQFSALVSRPSLARKSLQATLKDRQCNNEQTEKTPRQPTLRKIKRGVLPTH